MPPSSPRYTGPPSIRWRGAPGSWGPQGGCWAEKLSLGRVCLCHLLSCPVCDVSPTQPLPSLPLFPHPSSLRPRGARLSASQSFCVHSVTLSLCWLFLGCEGLGEPSWTPTRPAQTGKEFSLFSQLWAPRSQKALNPFPWAPGSGRRAAGRVGRDQSIPFTTPSLVPP